MLRTFLASTCVVASLLFSGCGPVSVTPSVDHPTIYAFSMPGCSGCIRDKVRVDQLERAGYTIIRVDIMAKPALRNRYLVDVVPFYLVVVNGNITLRTNNLDLVIRTVQYGCSLQEESTVPELSRD
jgi:hypothetical protein